MQEHGGALRNLTAGFKSISRSLVAVESNAIFALADNKVWRLGLDGSRTPLHGLPPDALVRWEDPETVASYEAYAIGDLVPSSYAVLESEHHIAHINVRSRSTRTFTRPKPGAELIALAQEADLLLFRHDSTAGSSLLSTRSDASRTQVALTFNTHLRKVAPSESAWIRYAAPKGGTLDGEILLPPRARRQKPYPLLVHVYPGSTGHLSDLSQLWEFSPTHFQLLTGKGYALLNVALPLDQLRTPDGPTLGVTPLVLAAVDEAVRRGYADPHRLGLLGYSQGCELALQIVTETNRFKSAIVGFGLSNLTSHYGTIPLAQRLSPDSFEIGRFSHYEYPGNSQSMGAKPWEDPARYMRSSPLFRADRIETPLLILHSDFDSYPLGQSEEIFSALYRLRKEASFVTYWGEGHLMLNPVNLKDMWRRSYAWLATHVLDAPKTATDESAKRSASNGSVTIF